MNFNYTIRFIVKIIDLFIRRFACSNLEKKKLEWKSHCEFKLFQILVYEEGWVRNE